MSDKEKAKAYDEALEIARKSWADNKEDGFKDYRKFLESMFPELAESEDEEDERIRKALIDLVSTVGEFYLPKLETRNKMLAYLEKQKVFSNGEGIYYYHSDGNYTFIGTGEVEPGEPLKTENNRVDLLGATPCVEKQKEQEPWKVGDSAYFTPDKETPIAKKEQKPLTDFEAAIYSYLSDDTSGKFSKEVMHKCAVERAKVLLELARKEQKTVDYDEELKKCKENPLYFYDKYVKIKLKEQKPVDYDHEMWKNCEANFEGGKKEVIDHPEKYGLTKQKSAECERQPEFKEVEYNFRGEKVKVIRPFFRDDKGREFSTTGRDTDLTWSVLREWCKIKGITPYDLYPRAEWSEEDYHWEGLVQLLRNYQKTIDRKSNNMAYEDVECYIAWLKSLRPSWKPSEEQMTALLELVTLSYADFDQEVLQSLYNDLKKFKGE